MKKMITPKLLFIAAVLPACFFLSCKQESIEDSPPISAKDSVETKTNPGMAANNDDTLTPVKTSSIILIAETIHSLTELNKRLNKKASHFIITTNRDTIIKCKEGTLLSIPANAFLNASNQNPVTGEVNISVKEFYKISDMMMQGLTTASNNQLLETGGMINIKVTSRDNKDSCALKPGKNITIALANSGTGNVDRMQLFNGVHGDNNVNWLPKDGIPALAQSWRFGRNNFLQDQFELNAGFVFPDGIVKTKPLVVNTKPENLITEMEVSIRDLAQHEGVITKKANGYVDTSGNLHCYKIGNYRQQISFNQIYSPTTVQNMKVNLAVDVNLNYKSNLNYSYYQKLFKMGKGNPDSLVTVTVTLNPALKITGFEKLKKIYKSALSVKKYQEKQKRRALLVKEYEKKLKQLKLEDERKLAQLEKNGTTNLQSAQNYLLLSTPKLGWINCDRFYNSPTKVDYFVKLKERASLLIVFNSIKSIISSDKNGTFHNVPLNEKITIVGLKTENGKLMMAMHETTITEKPFEALAFAPVTLKEYKSKLERLNGL